MLKFCLRSAWDVVFLNVLVGLSLFLISFYFHAQTIDTHYPDWIVHAFRIKSIQSYGLSSWTHVWANGINLWQSYQFIPHVLTLGLIDMTKVTITRGMVLMTIFLFIFLRISIYTLLRFLHFSPVTSFICAILSFDIAQYWGGVSDFSLLFGFTFFPLLLYCWIQYYQGKLQYLFPYLLGIAFYIHPVFGYLSAGIWIVGIIFSEKKIFSLSLAIQFCIFLASSLLFWFPIVVRDSYRYSSPVFANKYFLNLVLSSYKYYGLSIFVLGCFGIAAIRIFMSFEKNQKWVRTLFIFLAGYFLLVILGLSIDLPKVIAQLQFTRGVTFLGIGVLFVFAPVLEKLYTLKSRFIKAIILCVFSIAIVEGMWFTSEYSPAPGKDFTEAISSYNKVFPQKNIADNRIWSSDIGLSSYYSPNQTRLPYSYMGQLDSNQISPRISPLILYQPDIDGIPMANIQRINDYFKISGVKYVFFDETSPFTTTLLSADTQIYKDLGSIKTKDATYHLFEVPWGVRNAVAISPKYLSQLITFPFSLQLTEVNDQIQLDDNVKKFSAMIYAPENIPLTIQYPNPETLYVDIPKNLKTQTIYIDESFDKGWRGYINNQKVALAATGPNFMKVTLPSIHMQGILILKHHWPLWFYAGLFLILVFPVQLTTLSLTKKFLIHSL